MKTQPLPQSYKVNWYTTVLLTTPTLLYTIQSTTITISRMKCFAILQHNSIQHVLHAVSFPLVLFRVHILE